MFDPTYSQLIEKSFIPIRLLNGNQCPLYMGLEKEGISIIALHIEKDEYIIHSATNKYGRHYEQKEIDSLPKFDNINSLEDLIQLLKKDKTKSTFCPRTTLHKLDSNIGELLD